MEIRMNKSKKDEVDIARRGYHRWRQRKKTAKIYIAVMFAMCEGKCPECGRDMVLSFSQPYSDIENSATLDHTIPLLESAPHSKFGLRIMCKKCNSERQTQREESESND